MQTHELSYNLKAAQELQSSSHNDYKLHNDYAKVIDSETKETLVVSVPFDQGVDLGKEIYLNVPHLETTTLGGDRACSRQFGFMRGAGRAIGRERNQIPFPSTFLAYQEKIFNTAPQIEQLYSQHAPDIFASHLKAKEIPSSFRIQDTVFTNGLVNYYPSLKYHYDKGNYNGAATCVVIAAQGCEGVGLAFPQLNYAIRVDSGAALVIFRGDKLLHAPTPWKKVEKEGWRCSFVFYTLENMAGDE